MFAGSVLAVMDVGKMKITREKVTDMAWKAEGLDKLLESQGQRVDLRDINKAYNIALLPPHPGINPAKVQKEIEWAYKILDTLTQCYKYDSGKRRFNSILNNII